MSKRQRITILPRVGAVLNEDMMTFEGNDNRNGFICKLIERMMDDPEVDLYAKEQQQARTYESWLIKVSQQKKWLRTSLNADELMELAKELAACERRKTYKEYDADRRLRDKSGAGEALDMILVIPTSLNMALDAKEVNQKKKEEDRDHRRGGGYLMEWCYYAGKKDFIEQILWSYAQKPASERERIYCAKTIKVIQEAMDASIRTRPSLTIMLRSGQIHKVAPYAMTTDVAGNYTYLVGISENQDALGKYVYASFRVSRIMEVRLGTHREISKKQQEEIERRIETVGVAYMLQDVESASGESERAVVRLTKRGWKIYNNLTHNRPLYDAPKRKIQNKKTRKYSYKTLLPQPDEQGYYTLEFSCSLKQIIDYFHSFGADAYIVQPAKVRTEEFEKWYNKAYKASRSLSQGDNTQ